MDTLQCSFCSHENPADAKFCNACGSSLNLQLCGHCGAIDHVSSRACYKCGAPFAAGGASPEAESASTDEPIETASTLLRRVDPAGVPPALPPAPRPRSRARVWAQAAGIVLVALGAAFLYRLYGPDSRHETPRPADQTTAPAAVGAVSDAVTPPPPPPAAPPAAAQSPAAIQPPAVIEAPAVVQSPAADQSVAVDSAVATPLPGPEPGPASDKARATTPASVAATPPTAADRRRPPTATPAQAAPAPRQPAGARAPPYPCTAPVAALGLCDQ
jgi:double zinc ribbon protein